MAALTLNLLGDLEVIRAGVVMPLPPSKKTRGLLAYLALNDRAFRREQLCELLWEVPDDPRGSLRWSLSKLRRLVDDDKRRIIADRTNVAFDVEDVTIDVVELRTLAAGGVEEVSLEALETAAGRYRGNFLEGLELSNFHDFHAWCVAEREHAVRAQTRLLTVLTRRLSKAPERALTHARALVSLLPYDEAVRATLIKLLVALGRQEEAEQHHRLGMRMLEEVGAESTGALFAAWRGAPGNAPPRAAPRAAPRETVAVPTRDLLVGRDLERARLANLLADVAEHGYAQVLLIRGDPGIGKTRLLDVMATHARQTGAFLLEASAFESDAIRPFALWIDGFRRLGEDAPSLFESAAEDTRDQLFARLSDFIARETADRPVVLLFDDLQWCDESSIAALHYAARMNRERPLLTVLAAREEEVRDNGSVQQALRGLRHDALLEELKLGPLAEDAVRALIEARAPTVDSTSLCRQCAGNPLLAIELARAQVAGEGVSSLDELMRERLSRFDVDGAEVLRWAALLSPRIDVAALVRLSGLDARRVEEVLESAERQAMLQPAERGFRFAHELVGRSIYTDVSPARRRIMHRRVAELLEEDTALDLERSADLAHHATQSGDPALAARALVSAGRLCLRFFANEDAQTLARKGLALTGQLSDAEAVCLRIDLNDVLLAAAPLDDWEAAAERYVALAEQALDHGALGHARLGYHMASVVRWDHGHWAGAREQSLQAARVVRGGSEQDHITGMAETAKCLAMLERDLGEADAMLMEAQALAVRQRLRYHAIPAALGMLRYHENRLDEAEELFKEARLLCKSAGDRVNEFQANEYLVMIDFERGAFSAARARCAALIEIGEKLREGSEAPFARALDGLCAYAMQEPDATLEAALERLRIADAKHRLAYTLTRAALLDLERGRVDTALARATEALAYAEVLERPTETLLAHVALAQAHSAAGDADAEARHREAAAALAAAPVAEWARARSEQLDAPIRDTA